MSGRGIEPPPSRTRLVDEPVADNQWKKWIYNLWDKLTEPRYNLVSIENANLGKGATAPTEVIVGNYDAWEFTIGDDAVFNIGLPHDADPNEDIAVHFTYAINEAYATNSGEIQFQVDYSINSNDGGGTLTSPTSSGTLTTGDINIPAVAYTPDHSTTMTIPNADYNAGDIIGITLSRIAITDGSNPTADPAVLTFHLEYSARIIDWYKSI